MVATFPQRTYGAAWPYHGAGFAAPRKVRRLSIHRDDWDEIPSRLTNGGHVIRVDWFTTIPRRTVSVTVASKGPITLLVIPPGTAEGAAPTA